MSARRNVLTSQMLPNPAPTAAAPVSTVSTVGASGSAGELLRARRCVAAIDMDCFYAQCEELRHPELKGRRGEGWGERGRGRSRLDFAGGRSGMRA